MIRGSLKWVTWPDIFSCTLERNNIFAEYIVNNLFGISSTEYQARLTLIQPTSYYRPSRIVTIILLLPIIARKYFIATMTKFLYVM